MQYRAPQQVADPCASCGAKFDRDSMALDRRAKSPRLFGRRCFAGARLRSAAVSHACTLRSVAFIFLTTAAATKRKGFANLFALNTRQGQQGHQNSQVRKVSLYTCARKSFGKMA